MLVEATEPVFSSTVGELRNASGAQAAFPTPPLPAGAGQVVTRLSIQAPSDAAIVLGYVELLVKNEDGSEQIILESTAPITVAAGVLYHFAAADFESPDGVIGSDLSVNTDGSIKSTAGGNFFAQAFLTVA